MWLKNGQSYVSDDRVRTSSYGNVAQLELTSVSPQDQGVYQCLVFSEDDSAQDSVHLRIGGENICYYISFAYLLLSVIEYHQI